MSEFKYREGALKWLEDLETTDAKQAKEYLKVDDGYCCLGRACVVAAESGIKVDLEKLEIRGSLDMYEEVMEWIGLRGEEGEPEQQPHHPLHKPLVFMNDHQGKTFKEIAAHIRKYPEAYLLEAEDE